MTPEEEAKFRAAARAALALGGDIAMVCADGSDLSPKEFSVIAMGGLEPTVALMIPEAWEHEPDAEDRCQAIIREEEKAMTGQALD